MDSAPLDSLTACRPTVSVILPVMNEAANLPHVAERLAGIEIDELVVVDGNSADGSAALSAQLWPSATVIAQTRKGKGNALACGIAAATGDIVVLMDSDGSTDPCEIPRFVDALIGGADFAKGSRFVAGGASHDITPHRMIGNRALNGLVNSLFDCAFTDLCYGYNAFWRAAASSLGLPDVHRPEAVWGDGFEIETVINLAAVTSGMTIVEVASVEYSRIHGDSNLNAIRDGLRVLNTIGIEHRRRGRARRTSLSAPSMAPAPAAQIPADLAVATAV